ncbi:MAG TPA: FlgD immunoglobulin-like domain containing protein, partial [bacterium]|nr:FlgD immunoglobulin-like domain containing protein [bacterium]
MIDTPLLSLDNTKPSISIRLPQNDAVISGYPVSINIKGTAVDIDGRGDIPDRQASEMYRVLIKVEADYNFDGDYSDSTWYLDYLATDVANTSINQLSWSQWQFHLIPQSADTANLKISVKAIDNAGNSTDYDSQYIYIKYRPYYSDFYPPEVSMINVSPNPFSPNSDGVKDYIELNYSINERVETAVLNIYNYNNVLVRKITRTNQQPGANQIIWDGKDNNGNIVSEGQYKLELILYDASENKTTEYSSVVVDYSQPVISNVRVSNNPFSPNGDGIKDNTVISFDVSGIDASMTVGEIRAYKPKNTTGGILEFISGPYLMMQPSELVLITQGIIAYELRLILKGKDRYGNEMVSDEIVVPVGTKSNVLINVPGEFAEVIGFGNSTHGAQASEEFDYRFYLATKVGNSIVKIYKMSSEKVTELAMQPPFKGNGSYSVTWNGSGQPDGLYTFRIYVEDESGNEAFKEGIVEILTTSLEITDATVTPSTIMPGSSSLPSQALISFKITKPAYITANILKRYSVDTEPVQYLITDTALQMAGVVEVAWNGYDKNNMRVENGDYVIKINAYDPNTKRTAAQELYVSVSFIPQVILSAPVSSETPRKTTLINISGTAKDSRDSYDISSFQLLIDEVLASGNRTPLVRQTYTANQFNYNNSTGAWQFDYNLSMQEN